VCIYQVSGSDSQVGAFVRGPHLDRSASALLRGALSGPAPSGTCEHQPQFTVVSTGVGDWVNVELAGCWRVLREQPHLSIGTAAASTVHQLLHLG
jgi:hypothetical protein